MAILFMAIVIPVALGALRVAAMAGEAGQRKMVAARIASNKLNELKVENLLMGGAQRGVVQEGGVSYMWRESSELWTGDSISRMTLASVIVDYHVQDKSCSVKLSTLVPPVAQ